MKNVALTFLTFFILSFTEVFSANVDTVLIHSNSMNKDIKVSVITPDSYKKGDKFPVVYYLHGYSGNYKSWNSNEMRNLSDEYNFMLVFPDGNYSSWYLDSPIDPMWKYETFISNELISWINQHYKTISSKKGRAITGLSMGGHGALFNAFRHQEVFGACGSMSGGVDLRPFPLNWDIAKRIGDMKSHPENWDNYSVINQLYLLTPNSIKIIFDCGTDDFFYDVNLKLHNELLHRNIPHDFISRPGAHNSQYWDNSFLYQALFFSNYFKNIEKK